MKRWDSPSLFGISIITEWGWHPDLFTVFGLIWFYKGHDADDKEYHNLYHLTLALPCLGITLQIDRRKPEDYFR